jgi:hypothetical protein
MSFRNTRLWQSSLGSRGGDPHDLARARLRAALDGFRERAGLLAGEISADLPGLTAHDISHLDGLWTIADLIAGPSFSLTPTEAFVLGGAFLLHDLGLALVAYPGGLRALQERPEWRDVLIATLRRVLGREPLTGDIASPPPQAVEVVMFWMLRERHAAQAEALASTVWVDHSTGEAYHLLEDTDLRRSLGPLIGRIATSHWWPTSRLATEFPHTIGTPLAFSTEWTIDALKLALLLRLADAADLTARRAPSFLKVIREPDGVSGLHWAFQEKLYQPQREEDRLVYTSQGFAPQEAPAWWLAHDALRMVDTELRMADTLNSDLQRPRFAARGVRGVEDPRRLTAFVPAQGWTPVDAQVRVSHVADLVRKLGGRELYGGDQTIPLRELLQNASDAVRARRLLQGHDARWGNVLLRLGADEHGAWLEIEDDGVGMSAAVLTGPLLDFGVSFWSAPDAIKEFPTLLSKGFRSTGQYGIGFFSVFMWTDRVRITTRRFDAAMGETCVLTFDNGLSERPLLRPATAAEYLQDGGTRVRVWPRGVDDTRTKWIQAAVHDPPFAARATSMDPVEAAYWLCPTLDVNLFAEKRSGRRHRLVSAGDWLRIRGKQMLDRASKGTYSRAAESPFAVNVRPLLRDGQVVGRACVVPDGGEGVISVGGLRAKTHVRTPGLFLGESRNAARDDADLLVSGTELARWATEQAGLIAAMPLSPSAKAQCARTIGVLGGDIGDLPIAKRAGAWLDVHAITAWSHDKDSIFIIDETDEENIAEAGSEVEDFLAEPHGYDEFIAGGRMHARQAGTQRPVLQAIAAGWAPDELTVGSTTRWIQIWIGTTVGKHHGVDISGQEVTRRKLPHSNS